MKGGRGLRRLWVGTIAVGLFVFSSLAWMVCVNPGPRECARNLGFDFLAFYTAGTFVREGRPADLYDIEKVRTFEHDLARREDLELGKAVGPWWNPPFYAWAFVPLSLLTFRAAAAAWIVMNLVAVGCAAAILVRIFRTAMPSSSWQTAGLIPATLAVSAPFLLTLTHAQNAGVSLLILTLAISAWRKRKPLIAGAWIGILSYKPQLAAIMGLVLIVDLGWRAAAALALTVGSLLIVNLLTLPGTLTSYLHQLPQNLHYMQVEHPYNWDRHVTLKAFWRLLLQGMAPGETSIVATILTLVSVAILAALLMWGIQRSLGSRTQSDPRAAHSRDRMIAATIASTPLLMPFYFDYDLLLLAVPAVLCALDSSRRKNFDLAAWMCLFVWLYLNPFLAATIHVNGTVVLLALITTRMVLNLDHRTVPVESFAQEVLPPAHLAA